MKSLRPSDAPVARRSTDRGIAGPQSPRLTRRRSWPGFAPATVHLGLGTFSLRAKALAHLPNTARYAHALGLLTGGLSQAGDVQAKIGQQFSSFAVLDEAIGYAQTPDMRR